MCYSFWIGHIMQKSMEYVRVVFDAERTHVEHDVPTRVL